MTFQTRKEVENHLFRYIEFFYNRKRIHSKLGYLSPDRFESFYYSNLLTCKLTFLPCPLYWLKHTLLRGLFDDTAGFILCYGLASRSPSLWSVLSSMRFYQTFPYAGIPVTRRLGPAATGLSPARRCCLGARRTKKAADNLILSPFSRQVLNKSTKVYLEGIFSWVKFVRHNR